MAEEKWWKRTMDLDKLRRELEHRVGTSENKPRTMTVEISPGGEDGAPGKPSDLFVQARVSFSVSVLVPQGKVRGSEGDPADRLATDLTRTLLVREGLSFGLVAEALERLEDAGSTARMTGFVVPGWLSNRLAEVATVLALALDNVGEMTGWKMRRQEGEESAILRPF